MSRQKFKALKSLKVKKNHKKIEIYKKLEISKKRERYWKIKKKIVKMESYEKF